MALHPNPVRPRGGAVDECLRVIKGKHKADILIRLGRGTQRFGELRRQLPRISERMLAKQLHELACDGIVTRTVFPEVPPRVEYRLTPLGATLCPIIEQMWHWGRAYRGAPERG